MFINVTSPRETLLQLLDLVERASEQERRSRIAEALEAHASSRFPGLPLPRTQEQRSRTAEALVCFASRALERQVAGVYLEGSQPLLQAFLAVFGPDLRVPLISQHYPLRRVLVVGETGTGKEGMAQIIGEALAALGGRGKASQYRSLSAATFADSVLESELFGHAKGAFTGASHDRKGLLADVADRGTLFLDELDKTSHGFQARLLRVLESHSYRPVGQNELADAAFHLIAAASLSEDSLWRSDRLRLDLLHRLSDAVIVLPPLRAMLPDDPRARTRFLNPLVDRELGLLVGGGDAAKLVLQRDSKAIAGHIARGTVGHHWPGNLRQHANLVRQIAFQGLPRAEDLCAEMIRRHAPQESPVQATTLPGTLKEQLNAVERSAYAAAASRHAHIQDIATELGVTRQTASRRMLHFGLKPIA